MFYLILFRYIVCYKSQCHGHDPGKHCVHQRSRDQWWWYILGGTWRPVTRWCDSDIVEKWGLEARQQSPCCTSQFQVRLRSFVFVILFIICLSSYGKLWYKWIITVGLLQSICCSLEQFHVNLPDGESVWPKMWERDRNILMSLITM